MDKIYHNILVAVDGSEESNIAFERAINLAKKDGASLLVAHVLDTRRIVPVDHYDYKLARVALDYAKDLLNEYKQKAEEAGVTIETILEDGSPKTKITGEIAPKHNIDLIVAGATGLNKFERFLIGSVSTAIASHAKCDVLLVRNER